MDTLSTRLRYLLHSYTSGTATPAERHELMELIRMPVHETAVKELMGEEMEFLEQAEWEMENPASEERAAQILSTILSHPVAMTVVPKEPEQKRTIHRWVWRSAAAVLIIVAGLRGYRVLSGHQQKNIASVQALQDVAPGGNKAVLILANGEKIILDSAHSGKVAQQGDANVIKLDSGRLAYTSSNKNPGEVLYNILTTPRGGEYQLTLPDGSGVWLNAASSIKYPTAFTGSERIVEITGEAYFEVAKNKKMPFEVIACGTKTTVLGTHFNINAYTDEKTLSTTLLEGAVEFASGGDRVLLRPGQQALLNGTTRSLTVQEVDTYQAVAWTKGQFDFDNTDLPAIMRQISRWYDVDVSYHSTDENAKFGGGISRQLNLSDVLRLLDRSGVHTRLEGHKLIILP